MRFRIWNSQEEFLSVELWKQPISIHANKSAYQWGHEACCIRSHVSLGEGNACVPRFSLYKIPSHGRASVLEALGWSTCGPFAGNKMENPICNCRSSLWVTDDLKGSAGQRVTTHYGAGWLPTWPRPPHRRGERRECVSGRQPACPRVHPFLAY